MERNSDIREFLVSRRAKITPDRAGLPAYGAKRRVQGLRREEVAMLAGISVEYYTRLERGTASGVSEDVLDGIARALQLDEAERTHLFDLVRAANRARPSRSRRPRIECARPSSAFSTPWSAFRRTCATAGLDILAANRLGAALYSPVLEDPTGPPNMARFIFLNAKAASSSTTGTASPATRSPYCGPRPDATPYDKRLSDLIGELSTRSDEFRVRWAAHHVKFHRTGAKTTPPPRRGCTSSSPTKPSSFPAIPGQRILVYTAEPGSPTQNALDLLASWAATPTRAVQETTDRHGPIAGSRSLLPDHHPGGAASGDGLRRTRARRGREPMS